MDERMSLDRGWVDLLGKDNPGRILPFWLKLKCAIFGAFAHAI